MSDQLSGERVSVIIPSSGRSPALLERAVESALRQKGVCVEVVVVFDGCNGNASLGVSTHVTVISIGSVVVPAGPSTARNVGVHASTGVFVAFLDDDDWWSDEEYLSGSVSALKAIGTSLCVSDLRTADADGVGVDEYLELRRLCVGSPVGDGAFTGDRRAWLDLLGRRHPHLDVCVFRRSTLLELGAFNPALRFGEDGDLLFRWSDRSETLAVQPRVCATLSVRRDDSLAAGMLETTKLGYRVLRGLLLAGSARNSDVRRLAGKLLAWDLGDYAALVRRQSLWLGVRLTIGAWILRPMLSRLANVLLSVVTRR